MWSTCKRLRGGKWKGKGKGTEEGKWRNLRCLNQKVKEFINIIIL